MNYLLPERISPEGKQQQYPVQCRYFSRILTAKCVSRVRALNKNTGRQKLVSLFLFRPKKILDDYGQNHEQKRRLNHSKKQKIKTLCEQDLKQRHVI